ncbi:MAG: MopE-related protein [Myxococcales bacterium]|nr:MopE-related protein [Polyangiaceae bacterium]MDW8248824.1 MopE-related protein [Myxococcales bacterium]
MARTGFGAVLACLMVAGPTVFLAGCSTEAFCFNCEGPQGGGAAGVGGSGPSGAGQGGNGGSVVVVGGNAGAAGNDCGADLETDPQNCGACGNVCQIPGSNPTCVGGKCILDCGTGFYDLNKDPTDGCEYACTPSNGGVELCDDADNNCNGLIDEDVDTSGNINHCGACKSPCILANAVPTCAQGACQISECLPGFTDLDKDPKNGCEYACGVSNGGVEICDGLDNDCNSIVDDSDKVDTNSDPKNCGACGVSCAGKFANAVPTCQDSQCVLGACLDGYLDKNGDPSDGCEYSCQSTCNFPFATGVCQPDGSCTFGQCLFGYYDLNQDPSDGCEYACIPTSGNELCDGKDNNCDGNIDEGFDFTSDPNNCGSCGKRCDVLFPNATVACQQQNGQPTCVFTGCKPGFFNSDGNNTNGCEYDCTPSGPEVCDGLDNDCDGIADNPPGGGFNPPLPEQCDPGASVGACQSKTLCQGGQPTCVQVVGPSTEVCDGIDNDCDGETDEAPLPLVGIPCGISQVGECKFGTTVCQNGAIQCQGQVNPKPETCNGKDDDCNGIVDDNPTDVGGACGSSVGACKPGVQQCLGGTLTCVGDTKPTAEICDGPANTTSAAFDNDCDGQVNEGCIFPAAGITRLDTWNSNQGQHSSFQLSGASADSDFLVAYADGRSGGGDIYGRASTNAGSSWGNNDFLIAGESNVEVEPHVFLRPGRAYVAYSRFEGGVRRIFVRSANAPYTTWSAGVRVDSAPNSTVDCYSPQGVVAKAGATPAQDIIAVIWSEIAGTQASPTRNIYLRFSKDGGSTYGATLQINTGAGANKGELPVIASNGNGIIYVAWRDKRIPGLAQTYVGRADLNLADPAFTHVTVLQPNAANASSEQIVLAADSGNNAYVGWVDLRPPKKTIRVAYTNNAGVTWSKTDGASEGVVNLDSTFADANAPSLAARSGRVVVAWEDTRSGAKDIRVNFSTDGGKTWQPASARADTGDGLGATPSLTPRVAFGQNDHVFVTWQDLRFPSSAVLANVSIDLGKNFHPDAGAIFRMDINSGSPAAGAAADSQYPLILTSPLVNRASVVWIDLRDSSGNNGVNGDIWTRRLQ